METMLKLFVLLLAVWRLSRMLSDDTEGGPKNVLHLIRHKIGVRYNEMGEPFGQNWFAEALLCIKCISVWAGLVATVFYVVAPDIAFILALPFAFSGAALVIEGVIDGI